MSTNNDNIDAVKKANEEYRKLQEEKEKIHEPITKAHLSDITTPEEDMKNPDENTPVSQKQLMSIMENMGKIFSEQMQKLEESTITQINNLSASFLALTRFHSLNVLFTILGNS